MTRSWWRAGRVLLATLAVMSALNLLAAVRDQTVIANAGTERTTVQGKRVEWWARHAIQARKDANKRGRTIRRLKAQMRRGIVPWYWLAVGSCESGLRWTYNGGSGFDGAVQFHPRTWATNKLPGYPSYAYQASAFQQLVVAEIVLSQQGWAAWPACSRKLGLR